MKRQKNEKHLEYIRSLPCLVCGDDVSVQAAHIRYPDRRFAKRPTGLGERPDDKWTTPLCGRCHAEQHEGNERNFWQGHNIDPVETAAAFWANTGDVEAGIVIIQHRGEAF